MYRGDTYMNFINKLLNKWNALSNKNKKVTIGIAAICVILLLIIIIVIVSVSSKQMAGTNESESGTTSTEIQGTQNSELNSSEMNTSEKEESETLDTGTEDTVNSEDTEASQNTENTENAENTEGSQNTEDIEDPQHQNDGNMNQESGTKVDFEDVIEEANKNSNETQEITYGIDVAKYQGTIDWKEVAESGVDFVMVRVGYRTLKTGEIVADSNAKYNMQEAQKNGIKVGAYFFSTAVTEEEAIEEADWVADYIAEYRITYPVAFNCEGYEDAENRQYGLTKTQRTDIALAFLERIMENGYSPMFYASKNEMEQSAKWEMSRIDKEYKVWVAQYPAIPYPQTSASTYTGAHDMWQYTNQGTVPGIDKPVDVNVAYFGFRTDADAKDEPTTEVVNPDVEALMSFKEVNETVTAKESTNLRDKPSQGEDSKVMYTLKNGETATRTGISDSGWSRVVFNGKTYYAVSSLLTTDLSVKQPNTEEPDTEPDTESGTVIKTQFTEVNEQVTAKEVVNLRTLPSTTNENSEVVAQLKNGEVVARTGINTDLGWSRVEYNGQVLYCVSSYLTVVEEEIENAGE